MVRIKPIIREFRREAIVYPFENDPPSKQSELHQSITQFPEENRDLKKAASSSIFSGI
jgi:hypothetical protein